MIEPVLRKRALTLLAAFKLMLVALVRLTSPTPMMRSVS